MVEDKPISIGNIAYVLGMSSKKLHRWYQQVLSGFTQAKQQGEISKNDLEVKEQGEKKIIKVSILEEKNLGKQMAIDEKQINGTVYTILSNRKTNKIALMASTLKTKHLMKLLSNFSIEKRMEVESLTRDMASNYDWLGRQAFMNAYHVIDKFHIIKNVMEQLQSVRIRYRQEALAKRREIKETKQKYKEQIFANGDTTLQLLAHSRGLLFSMPNKWSEQQKERAEILFKNYPELKQAYRLVLKFRRWFTPPNGKTTYSKTREKKKEKLIELISQFKQSGIEEMKNIAYLLQKNLSQILHYFIEKETNAKAEALNRNLQRFININFGTRNIDFFLYRIKLYFA